MSVLSFLFALACVPASGNLDVTASNNNNNVDDSGDTGEPEPEPHFAAGEYEGSLGWEIPDWDWVLCDMDFEITVDEEGNFSGEDVCIYYSQGGYEYELEVSVDGLLDEDGEATGTIQFQSWAIKGDWYIEDFEAELDGGVDGDDLEFEFEEVADFDEYGEGWMYGWVDVRR